MSNGYFQLGCTPTGTILKLIRPTDGGQMVTAKEITEYLSKNQILYSAPSIGQGVDALMASTKPDHLVLLNKDAMGEVNESYQLRASSDKMQLTARFYAPSMKGKRLTADEFIRDLAAKNVKNGINEDVIRAFFEKPQYCTDVIVAEGKPVKQGQHAWIEYMFDTDISQKPALNEDGSVDFFNLKTFAQCNKGDVLAVLHPEVRGEGGITIFGEVIPPFEVKRAALKYGKNISLSEDGHSITSDVTGHVSLVEGKVFVSDVYEVDNVGPATGNVEYDGNIRVLGNVAENFSIKAGGDIEIRGVVEGATIEAEGNITIARGMKGMGKGVLKAGNNIISKFFEMSEVEAGGFVETESILHSTVSAKTEIIVTGKHGFISGGRVSAGNLVRAKTLGTDMGATTIIEVGADPKLKVRLEELKKNIQKNMKAIDEAKPKLEGFLVKMKSGATISLDQKMYFQTLAADDKKRKEEILAWQEEVDSLEEIVENTTGATVEVTGDVYAGTKICISDVSMVVKNTMTYARFKKVDGDVKMTAL